MRSTLMLVVVLGSLAFGASASEPEWEVENRFRPFDYVADPAKTYRDWAVSEGQSLDAWWREDNHRIEPPFETYHNKESVKPALSYWDFRAESYLPDRSGAPFIDAPAQRAIRVRVPHASVGARCNWTGDGIVSAPQGATPCAEWTTLDVRSAAFTLRAAESPSGRVLAESSTPQRIDTFLILGLGDSFASGEGNPDTPSTWNDGKPNPGQRTWMRTGKKGLLASGPRWIDPICNRGFRNYQTFVALQQASVRKHSIVVPLQFACSGAEILDGVMVPQFKPPGHLGNCRQEPETGDRAAVNEANKCHVRRSQAANAMLHLCPSGSARKRSDDEARKLLDATFRNASKSQFEQLRLGSRNAFGLDIVDCDQPRRPDVVLLSIGGNDIGFAMLAAWSIVPTEVRLKPMQRVFDWAKASNVVCPKAGFDGCHKRRKTATEHVDQLPPRYASLRNVFDAMFGEATPVPVYLNAYPDPLRRDAQAKELLCGWRDEPKTLNPTNGWYAASDLTTQGLLAPFNTKNYHWNITAQSHDGEADAIWRVVEKLRDTMRSSANAQQFRYVADAGEVMVGHGFCVGERGEPPEDPQYHVPSVEPVWAPRDWEPYALRERYVRTLNDAVLTQMRPKGLLPNGILHPTAHSHAATADAVIEALAADGLAGAGSASAASGR